MDDKKIEEKIRNNSCMLAFGGEMNEEDVQKIKNALKNAKKP